MPFPVIEMIVQGRFREFQEKKGSPFVGVSATPLIKTLPSCYRVKQRGE